MYYVKQHSFLSNTIYLAHRIHTQFLYPCNHILHQQFGCGDTGTNADMQVALQPFLVEFACITHQTGKHLHVARHFAQAVGVGATGRTDHERDIALLGLLPDWVLAILCGVADVVFLWPDYEWEARL